MKSYSAVHGCASEASRFRRRGGGLAAALMVAALAQPASACLFDDNPGVYSSEGGWISDSAHVDSTAYIGSNSWVCEYSRVSDQAVLRSGSTYGAAHVYENARLISARVGGLVQV